LRISLLLPQYTRLTILIVGLTVVCALRAEAGCGDYLVHATAQHMLDHAPAVPIAPCEGPYCSQNPSTPVAPVSTPRFVVPELKAIAESDLNGTDPDGNPVRHDIVTGEAIDLPNSIFHPPRS